MAKGFDGYAPIDPTAAKAAGAIAVSGYLVGNVPMTREWCQACSDAGLLIWSAWELSATAPELGAPQGAGDANAACAAAEALGQPAGTGIYFANDSVITDINQVLAYFWAVAPIVKGHGYVPGLYGQTSLYETIKGSYPLFWHASDGSAPPWPGQIVQPGTKETLSSGETVDVDEITTSDFGGWNYTPVVVTPPPTTKEDDMTLIRVLNSAEYYVTGGFGIVNLADGSGDLARLQAAKVPEVELSQALVLRMLAAAKNHIL